MFGLPLLAAGAAAPQEVLAAKAASRDEAPIVTYYRTKTIDGIKIFYREAGPADAPVVHIRGIGYKGTIEVSTRPHNSTSPGRQSLPG